MEAAATRNEEIDFTLQIKHAIAGRSDSSCTLQEVLTPVLQRPPTCSVAIFAAVFSAVARRLPGQYRIVCEPTADERVVEIMTEGDGVVLYDMVKGQMDVLSREAAEKRCDQTTRLSPCAVVSCVSVLKCSFL